MVKHVKISVFNSGTSLNQALKLIEVFKKINHIDFKLEIKLDMAEKDLGYFNYLPDENVLYINPIRCTNKKFNDLLGHPVDCSIFSTVVHEFSHLLDLKFNLHSEYTQKNFALERLIMTSYTRKDKYQIEELADMISIYLINPYYLKLIDLERYKWIKTKFKSPVPCGSKTFLRYYNDWPKRRQKMFCDKYSITVKDDQLTS